MFFEWQPTISYESRVYFCDKLLKIGLVKDEDSAAHYRLHGVHVLLQLFFLANIPAQRFQNSCNLFRLCNPLLVGNCQELVHHLALVFFRLWWSNLSLR